MFRLSAIFLYYSLFCLVENGFSQINSPAVVQTEAITVAGITSDAQIYSLPNGQKITNHVFYDGLGRVIEQIAVKNSPSQNDLIKYTTYNNLGQSVTKNLPYVNGSDGAFHALATASSELTNYYNNGTSDKVTDDSNPWSKIIVEAGPSQRLLSAGMNGTGFQPTTGSHYKTIDYRSYNPSIYINDSYNAGVRLWLADGTSSTTYAAGSLTVSESKDEAGQTTAIYTDAFDRVVLERRILSPAMTIEGTTENCLDKYYIYDDAGEQLFIVPPKAVVALRTAGSNPWNVTLAAASEYIYSFGYDMQGRVTQKKKPNSDWIFTIYDPVNRPVLIQDANLRLSNKWRYVKYDIEGRIISEGIYTDGVHIGISAMQTYVNGLGASVYTTYYYEEKQSGGTAPNFYTNRIFPTTNQDATTLQDLHYSYYDNYDFNNDGTADYAYQSQGLTGESAATSLTRTAPTGSYIKSLNNSGSLSVWTRSVMFYDKYGQIIQTSSNNHLTSSANDLKTIVRNFKGKPLIQKVSKTVGSGTTTSLATYTYDNSQRLSTIDQANNGSSSVRVLQCIYNEIGQLVLKKLHSTDNTNFLQNVDFRFNINGQLTSINNATLTADANNGETTDIFGEEILYDKSDPTGLGNVSYFNGNISAVKWKAVPPSSGNTNQRSYKYSYDILNRLSTAHYSEWNVSSNDWTQCVGYNDENVTAYDHQGNIKALNRYSGNTLIDNLTYTLTGNQLSNVSDAAVANTFGFNPVNAAAYNYNSSSGNLISDPKKGISSISYNILNKTDKILFTNGNYIQYSYDAFGGILRKDVYTASSSTMVTSDYIDGFVFQNGILAYFGMAEGRVRNSGSTLVFEYFIKDHLGNVRVSFDGAGTLATARQENSFYPFGMTMSSSYIPTSANPNLFNGASEWQNDFGNNPDLYQSGYRNYDPELGRFIAVDPMAGMTSSESPYHYAGNNPISFSDPSGLLKPAPGTHNGPGLHIEPGSDLDAMNVNDITTPYSINGGGNYGYGQGLDQDPLGVNSTQNPANRSHPWDPSGSGGPTAQMLNEAFAYAPDNASTPFHYLSSQGFWRSNAITDRPIHTDIVGLIDNGTTTLTNSFFGIQHSYLNFSKLWADHERDILPDMIGLHLNLTGVMGLGGSGSVNFDYLTRGPEQGWHFSRTTSIRVGLENSATLSFHAGNYQGLVSEITYGSIEGFGFDATFDMGGGSLGVWGSLDTEHNRISWAGWSVGGGLGFGSSGGVSHTDNLQSN